MNTEDMAQFISVFIDEVFGVKISYETVREKLEKLTE